MGAGKTTIGRQLSNKLGWNFIDLDEEIERSEHRAVAEIFRDQGEPHFRQLERAHLKRVSSFENTVVALGGGAFLAAENREIAETTGLTVWLKASFAKVAGRVKIDGTRPNFADREQAEALYQKREPYYALAKVHVSTDDGTPEAIADEIIGVLRKS
jgi:shikimate kinase